MHKAVHAYLATKVTTTSQGDVLLMLYDAAIKNLKLARVKIEEKDYAGKGILISKAIDIISELSSSLNPEKGGSLAENLHNLYFYSSTKLLQANLKMDTGILDEVVKILEGIRSAFAEIIPGQAPQEQPATGTASAPKPQSPTPQNLTPREQPTLAPRPAAPRPEPTRPVPPIAGYGPALQNPVSQAPRQTETKARKSAPVTPLNPGRPMSNPLQRAVAAYGNAR